MCQILRALTPTEFEMWQVQQLKLQFSAISTCLNGDVICGTTTTGVQRRLKVSYHTKAWWKLIILWIYTQTQKKNSDRSWSWTQTDKLHRQPSSLLCLFNQSNQDDDPVLPESKPLRDSYIPTIKPSPDLSQCTFCEFPCVEPWASPALQYELLCQVLGCQNKGALYF